MIAMPLHDCDVTASFNRNKFQIFVITGLIMIGFVLGSFHTISVVKIVLRFQDRITVPFRINDILCRFLCM